MITIKRSYKVSILYIVVNLKQKSLNRVALKRDNIQIIQRICENFFGVETGDILTNGATMCIIYNVDWYRVRRVNHSRKKQKPKGYENAMRYQKDIVQGQSMNAVIVSEIRIKDFCKRNARRYYIEY